MGGRGGALVRDAVGARAGTLPVHRRRPPPVRRDRSASGSRSVQGDSGRPPPGLHRLSGTPGRPTWTGDNPKLSRSCLRAAVTGRLRYGHASQRRTARIEPPFRINHLEPSRSSHGHPRNHIRISPMDNPHRLLLHREGARCYAMGECVPACRGRPTYRHARSACAPVAGRPRGGTRTADKPSLAVEEWSRGRRARAHQFRAEISSRYWDAPAGRGRDPVPQCWYEQY